MSKCVVLGHKAKPTFLSGLLPSKYRIRDNHLDLQKLQVQNHFKGTDN